TVAHFPPLFMMLMVYAGIALVMTFTYRRPLATRLSHIILISALAVTIQGAMVFIGLKGLPATTANLVLQTQVPFAVLLGWLVGGEALDGRKSLGTVIALAGVAMVIGLPEAPPPLAPVMLVIGGAFIWALGQVFARKYGRDGGAGILKANALGSLPQLLLASLLLEQGQIESLATATGQQWLMLLFVGVFGYYVAYSSWYSVLRQCPIEQVAPFMLLMPVVGIGAAAVLLDESISPAQILGGLTILAGLAIVSVGRPKTAAPESAAAS
ncbi:MAG: EamA family transporter, partial [Rhizobiales bacterium]|nr:EamA family transporter [Hyphomicrobiales bacterium]